MRYHLFLHYGWFLQNLGKDFIWSFTPLFVSSLSVTKSLSLLFHLGHMSMSFHTLFIWWLLNTSHFPFLNSHTHKKKSCLILLVFAFPYLTVLHFMQQTDWYRNSDKETQFELWRFKVEQKNFHSKFYFFVIQSKQD